MEQIKAMPCPSYKSKKEVGGQILTANGYCDAAGAAMYLPISHSMILLQTDGYFKPIYR
jgi:hypothetical protein